MHVHYEFEEEDIRTDEDINPFSYLPIQLRSERANFINNQGSKAVENFEKENGIMEAGKKEQYQITEGRIALQNRDNYWTTLIPDVENELNKYIPYTKMKIQDYHEETEFIHMLNNRALQIEKELYNEQIQQKNEHNNQYAGIKNKGHFTAMSKGNSNLNTNFEKLQNKDSERKTLHTKSQGSRNRAKKIEL